MPHYVPRSQNREKRYRARKRKRERNWDKQYRISRKNTIAMAKPGIMTLLNLTVVHYSPAFLNDWLLSFNVFFSPRFLFSSQTFVFGHTETHKCCFSGDLQLTLRFFFSSNINCAPLIMCKNILWTQWETLTWFLPTTDAWQSEFWFMCQCFEYTLYSVVSCFWRKYSSSTSVAISKGDASPPRV